MSDKFDDYLKKGGFSDTHKEALQNEKAHNVERDPLPQSRVGEAKPEAPAPQLSESAKTTIDNVGKDGTATYDQQQKPEATNKSVSSVVDRFDSQGKQAQQDLANATKEQPQEPSAPNEKGNSSSIDAAQKEGQQPSKEPDPKDKGNEQDQEQDR